MKTIWICQRETIKCILEEKNSNKNKSFIHHRILIAICGSNCFIINYFYWSSLVPNLKINCYYKYREKNYWKKQNGFLVIRRNLDNSFFKLSSFWQIQPSAFFSLYNSLSSIFFFSFHFYLNSNLPKSITWNHNI